MHDLWFFDFFFSKIIFTKTFFSYCRDKFNYPGSIAYFSCLYCLFSVGFDRVTSKSRIVSQVFLWVLEHLFSKNKSKLYRCDLLGKGFSFPRIISLILYLAICRWFPINCKTCISRKLHLVNSIVILITISRALCLYRLT